MTKYGIGIGSFVTGLMEGADFSRKMKQSANAEARLDKEDARGDREFDLKLEDRIRSIKRQDEEDKWNAEDRSYKRTERTATQPLIDAERRAKMTDLENKAAVEAASKAGTADATTQYEQSRKANVVQKTDPATGRGLPEYTVDGKTVSSIEEANRLHDEKHGSLMDHIYKVAIPQRQEAYAKAGDVQSAAALGKWASDEKVRKGIESVGRLEAAFAAGDWEGVNKSFHAVHANNDYMDTSNFDIVTEPIKKDGKVAGLKATIKDKKTGNETTTNYDDLASLRTALMGKVNPFAVFEANKAEMAAASAARLDMAKGNTKLANDIELERQKAIFAIAKDAAGVGGKGAVEALQARLAGQLKVMSDNNMEFNKLPATEQAKAAMAVITAQDAEIAGKVGQAAPRPAPVLYSR